MRSRMRLRQVTITSCSSLVTSSGRWSSKSRFSNFGAQEGRVIGREYRESVAMARSMATLIQFASFSAAGAHQLHTLAINFRQTPKTRRDSEPLVLKNHAVRHARRDPWGDDLNNDRAVEAVSLSLRRPSGWHWLLLASRFMSY